MHEEMVVKAKAGDEAAKKLVEVVSNFARYCRIAIATGERELEGN
jgi:hypothetical protein